MELFCNMGGRLGQGQMLAMLALERFTTPQNNSVGLENGMLERIFALLENADALWASAFHGWERRLMSCRPST